MLGICGKRLLVPELRIVVAAKLAAGVADVISDVRVVVPFQRPQAGDPGFVFAAFNQIVSMPVAIEKVSLALLLGAGGLLVVALGVGAFLIGGSRSRRRRV